MALATLTTITPNFASQFGSVAFSVKGSGFSHCISAGGVVPGAMTVWFRFPDSTTMSIDVTVDSDTSAHGFTPSFVGYNGQYCDVGVYDNTAAAAVWALHALFVGTAAPTPAAGLWDLTRWDASAWQARHFAPGVGWGYDWQVWYQYAGKILWDMTEATVEARWSTDSHAMGDGSYRGDLQPGTLALQLHDPAHIAETLDKRGTIWLHYAPAKFTWGFYLETVTRQLVAPGDATAADVVLTATAWPLRLTTDCTHTWTRPAERTDTRLTALAGFLSQNADLQLPRYTANVAAQSQVAAPVVVVGATLPATPAALSLLHDGATDGVAWLSGAVDTAGLGYFVLNYARWEATTLRDLVPSDLVAGIPYDSTMDDVITLAEWQGVDTAGVATTWTLTNTGLFSYGLGKVTMRLYGNVASGGAEQAAAVNTSAYMMATRGDPTRARLSTVTATSGPRVTSTGGTGPAWHPPAHVWAPNEVVTWHPPAGDTTPWLRQYYVQKTDHRLRAAAWDSAHTLEPWCQVTALPA